MVATHSQWVYRKTIPQQDGMWYNCVALSLAWEMSGMWYFLTICGEIPGVTMATELETDLRCLLLFNIHVLSPCLQRGVLCSSSNTALSIKPWVWCQRTKNLLEPKVWLKLGRIIFSKREKSPTQIIRTTYYDTASILSFIWLLYFCKIFL